jgi:hypothetical protein
MKTWVQRIRGAVGIGVTWAVGWAPIGAIIGWITAAVFGFPAGAVTANYALMFGLLGLLGGAMFSSLLSLTERHRGFHELSMPRFVAWGAMGGLALGGLSVAAGLLGAGITTLGAVMAGTVTLLGAGSAAATLAIARAADPGGLLDEGEATDHARTLAP